MERLCRCRIVIPWSRHVVIPIGYKPMAYTCCPHYNSLYNVVRITQVYCNVDNRMQVLVMWSALYRLLLSALRESCLAGIVAI